MNVSAAKRKLQSDPARPVAGPELGGQSASYARYPRPGLRTLAKSGEVAACVLMLAACANLPQPYAVVDGHYRGKVEPHRAPVLITKVDGQSLIQQPAFIEPGLRRLSFVSTAPWGQSRLPREETLTVRIEPCMHYVFAAQHANRISERFQPVIDEVYPHPGCRIADRAQS